MYTGVASDVQAQAKFTLPELFKISPYWKPTYKLHQFEAYFLYYIYQKE